MPLGLDAAEHLELLLGGLEPTVAELGGRVDELELDLLQRTAAGLLQQGPPQGDGPLAGADHRALDGCVQQGGGAGRGVRP